MAGAGGGGDEYHQLDGAQRLLVDAMNAQMQRLLDRTTEEVYGRLEALENQANQNAKRNIDGNRGNPCGVYPDLSSFIGSGVYPDLSFFTGSGVIQISVTCIKRSAPTQVHITLSAGICKKYCAMSAEKYQSRLFRDRCQLLFFLFNR